MFSRILPHPYLTLLLVVVWILLQNTVSLVLSGTPVKAEEAQ